MAVARQEMSRENTLEHLGAKVPTTMLEKTRSADPSGDELSQLRTDKLKNLNPHLDAKPVSAEFFLLFNSSGKVEETLSISGAEQLRLAGDALSGCNLVLYTPNSVTSVN